MLGSKLIGLYSPGFGLGSGIILAVFSSVGYLPSRMIWLFIACNKASLNRGISFAVFNNLFDIPSGPFADLGSPNCLF